MKFDLVLTGLQSDDQGHAQMGVILAERLGIPHSTIIMEVQIIDSRLRVKRELEGGWFQWIAMPLPALLTIQSGINQLRYATLKGIMAAKKKAMQPPAGSPSQRRCLRGPKRHKSSEVALRGSEGAGAAPARRGTSAVILVIEHGRGELNRYVKWRPLLATRRRLRSRSSFPVV
jgi:electron transfer flavoprotein beta subunit